MKVVHNTNSFNTTLNNWCEYPGCHDTATHLAADFLDNNKIYALCEKHCQEITNHYVYAEHFICPNCGCNHE